VSCSGFFVSLHLNRHVIGNRLKPLAVAISAAALAVALFLVSAWIDSTDREPTHSGIAPPAWLDRARKADFPHSLELITYDWRVRESVQTDGWRPWKPNPAEAGMDDRLRMLWIGDDTFNLMRLGHLTGKKERPLWPRHVYARALRELDRQNVRAVGFDMFFPDHYEDPPGAHSPQGVRTADEWFAAEMRKGGNVIIGVDDKGAADQFVRSAWRLGGVGTVKDVDGCSRRIRAFEDQAFLDPELQLELRREGKSVDLERCSPTNLVFHDPLHRDGENWPVAPDNTVELVRDDEVLRLPAFRTNRIWHMGIALAAFELGLDLDTADVQPHRIRLQGPRGAVREIPTDSRGYFSVAWTASAAEIEGEPLATVMRADWQRAENLVPSETTQWTNKLVVVGSNASGNNLADLGATPLEKLALLAATYPNVANSVLKGRFVHRWSLAAEVALVALVSLSASALTWWLRPGWALLAAIVLACVYFLICIATYTMNLLWLPLVYPLVGALALAFPAMTTWRVIFAQSEQRRVKSVFTRIVSPNVVQELLRAERLALRGDRRHITVFFADVRGFTAMTDQHQAMAEEQARERGLTGAAAEAHFEDSAQEVLATVNRYLAAIAEVIKFHNGTLDKYIGDCVMAFWGAPTPNSRHAVDAVVTAIDAQRAIARLNAQRRRENEERATAIPPLPPLALLELGTGINTGFVTVGLMGSDQHILNYTVFGREVNLASRLEGVSDRSRIVIGHGTYEELKRLAPALAATCIELKPVLVKGFRQSVQVYEVPWQEAEEAASKISELFPDKPLDSKSG
jgi:class 3 adenylate cyclase/CHASE2 domain-containing sensor protein